MMSLLDDVSMSEWHFQLDQKCPQIAIWEPNSSPTDQVAGNKEAFHKIARYLAHLEFDFIKHQRNYFPVLPILI